MAAWTSDSVRRGKTPARDRPMRGPGEPCRIVTAGSPPDISTAGGGAGVPFRATEDAMAAMSMPSSRASRSRASPSRIGVMPRASATRTAACSEACGMAMNRNSDWSGRAGEEVESSLRATSGRPEPSRSARYDRYDRSSPAVGSATVGPEAMAAGSSPGTSGIASVTIRAPSAACASPPPLMRESRRRTLFIALIERPEARRSRFTSMTSFRGGMALAWAAARNRRPRSGRGQDRPVRPRRPYA
ncbi:hypothetical protein PMES_00419 [Profundibacterium mesophilum KAUST100406-0324]|uniref:Uncharacterized protein n=1 Tax=Profundibacterium mesophilum KAUST100406-0324 TaxID=1037889 RepID=A0A921NSE4_9RHOB|nr:hypothetical protein PMES_00419 [Profundibacterium mesophilum KAUST100406-0324]